jgi:DNA (cytosine-5)-methyltransferase 1
VYVGETAHDVEPGDDGVERFACAEHCETCRPLRVLSLFSGIGGLDLGLERAGMEVVAQCEVDPYCCRVLAKHWPDVPNLGDVTTIDWSTVPDVDLICGGYPCQPFSLAGRRQGADDVRHLWPYVLDAVRHLRPSWVLLENVPGHLSLGFGRVLGGLAESGYDAEWDCIPAAAVGAHHRRDRVFIVAYPQRDELRVEPVAVGRGGGAAVVGDDGPTQPVADADQRGRFGWTGAPGPSWRSELADSGTAERRVFAPRRGDAARRRRPGIDGWAAEPDVGRVAHGVPSRVDRLRGLGNAVVPQVAEHVGRLIMEAAS